MFHCLGFFERTSSTSSMSSRTCLSTLAVSSWISSGVGIGPSMSSAVPPALYRALMSETGRSGILDAVPT